MAIDRFIGQYRFLSNFHPSVVTYEGKEYSTIEHAYQAAKTIDLGERETIRLAQTPGIAKRAGKKVNLRDDWDEIKVPVMTGLVWQKFQEPGLRQQLLDTGSEELIEGNTWGDRFWGVSRGTGQNWLGRILMKVRGELAPRTEE
jgi:ribA/ribD-fused uncharacterized protein